MEAERRPSLTWGLSRRMENGVSFSSHLSSLSSFSLTFPLLIPTYFCHLFSQSSFAFTSINYFYLWISLETFFFLWIRDFNRRKVLNWETAKNRLDIPLTPRKKAAAAPTESSAHGEGKRLKQGEWNHSFDLLCQEFWVLWDFICLISFSSFPRMYL